MIQGRSSFGFALEAAESLLIFGHFIGQELEGDKATEFDILGLIDDTHAAATQFLDDAVVRDGLADHSVGSRACWERMLVGSRGQVNQKLALWPYHRARLWPLNSLQLRVLRLSLLQDRDVGVGVFPEGEEILVGGAGFGGVAGHRVGSAELKMGQCPDRFV
jgi:hypothetical protein